MSAPGTPSSAPGWEMVFAWCPPEGSRLLCGTATGRRLEVASQTHRGLGSRRRRHRLLARARGRVLEIGVGNARNLACYPIGVDLTGVDVSEAMLERAGRRSEHRGRPIRLELAEATALPYPDATFDTTVATCVFCTITDPVTGLRELGRVTKPDGRILLLEHVRPRNRISGWLADLVSDFTRELFGFQANRRTEENIAAAGLGVVEMRSDGIWREIVARPQSEAIRVPVGES